jgi:uncharacterized protein YkwD
VFVLVNQQRAARGLQPLARVGALDRCAQDYAVRMAREGFFAHTAPDGSTPGDRIAAYQYNGRPYRFLVNGQTGEVQGEAPLSWWKITFAVLAALLVALIVWLLFGQHQGG